jgi:DNA polymerase-3 subunit delta'
MDKTAMGRKLMTNMDNRVIFPQLIGNSRIKNILGGDIARGTMGHAYILVGPAGSGKHTAALSIASALACEYRKDGKNPLPCGKCLACRKIAEGVSPDVSFIRRAEDRATLGVSIIRELREDLYIAPNENEKKVYIIEEADRMTDEAQNALLLSLESPPPYVVFLLLTQNVDSLLETIRSRAPVLKMQTFGADEIYEVLVKDPRFAAATKTDRDYFARAVAAADGAIGRAVQILDKKSEEGAEYLSAREDALRTVSLLFFPDYHDAVDLLNSLPKAREDVLSLLRLSLMALRDLAAVKKNASVPLMLYVSAEECRGISDKVSIARISAAYDEVFLALSDIQSNASVRTVFSSLLLNKH